LHAVEDGTALAKPRRSPARLRGHRGKKKKRKEKPVRGRGQGRFGVSWVKGSRPRFRGELCHSAATRGAKGSACPAWGALLVGLPGTRQRPPRYARMSVPDSNEGAHWAGPRARGPPAKGRDLPVPRKAADQWSDLWVEAEGSRRPEVKAS